MKFRVVNKFVSLSLILSLSLSAFSFQSVSRAEILNSSIDEKDKVIENIEVEKKRNISKELEEELKTDRDFYDVMIYFKDEASTYKAKKEALQTIKTDEAKSVKERRAVINALFETALKSQDKTLRWLESEKELGNVSEIQSFFIVNSIHLIAKKEVIEELAYDEDIEKITVNETLKQDEPIKVIKRQKRSLKEDEIEWNIKKIGANKAWEDGVTGTGVVVGIMDSAVDPTHPALKEKFRGYDEETGSLKYEGNYLDAIEHTRQVAKDTDVEHGTHCMGIILGSEKDENGLPINMIGVAPDAKFISARVFGNNGESSTAAFLEAAQWMLAPGGKAQNAPSIINNSWGGGYNKDTWFRKAVKAWRDANILPVFASGNQQPGEPEPGPESISAPASYAESLAVGAVDSKSKLAFFSKRGPSPLLDVREFKPEISAPGVNVRSSVRNSYEYMSGTSMAAPHVSGVAALVKSANSNLSAAQIQSILLKTAVPATDANYPTSPNYGYGYGIVNAYAAVAEATDRGNSVITGRVFSGDKPVLAEIYIKETGRSVFSDSGSGMFSMKHPAGEYTLVCRAYGYDTKEQIIQLQKNESRNVEVELEKKEVKTISGNIKNATDSNIEGAYIYLLEDDNIEIEESNESGNFQITDLPYGTYTIRVFKESYELYEAKIEVNSSTENLNIVLQEKDVRKQSEEDKHDNGNMNTIADQNMPIGLGGFGGAAVRFVPKKTGASIDSISVQFYKRTLGYQGDKAKLVIKTLDERGRHEVLLEGEEFSFSPGELKTISLEKYGLKTDKPFYAIITYAARKNLPFIIGMDSSGDPDFSYVLSGENFLPIGEARVYGALMIRAGISYPEGATDIVYDVPEPTVKPIYPEKQIIEGTALPNQTVQVVIGNDLRINTIADGEGRFKFDIKKPLRAGEEIVCYAKNKDGISSSPVRVIVLTNKSELKKNLAIAESFKTRAEGTDANAMLIENINKVKTLISEIEEYEKSSDIDRAKIREYQNSMDSLIIDLKNAILELSPEKKPLKIAIDEARELLEQVLVSANGKDVPETRFWLKSSDWNAFNNKVLSALVIYNKADAKEKDIEKAISNLKKAKEKFIVKQRKGKKYLITIDHRYRDGKYEGEGRGRNLIASHVVIDIKDGKIINIELGEWNESEVAKEAILKDGFLTRIIENNALDVNMTKSYEKECEAIIKAITQAAEKALKDGEKLNIDKTILKDLIDKANDILTSYPVSKDGKDVPKGRKWTLKVDKDDLTKAIKKANEEFNREDLTIDMMNKAVTILNIAIKNFESSLKLGTIDVEDNIVYRDGEYTESAYGYNRLDKNTFRITIKDGKIAKIDIVDWKDTPTRIAYINNDRFFERIIENNSPDVDLVSGATLSSISIRDSVREALNKAKSTKEEKEIPLPLNDYLRKDLELKIFEAKELLYKTRERKTSNRQEFIDIIKEIQTSNKDVSATKTKIINEGKRIRDAIGRFK